MKIFHCNGDRSKKSSSNCQIISSCMHEWIISSIVSQFHSMSIKEHIVSYILCAKKNICSDNGHLKCCQLLIVLEIVHFSPRFVIFTAIVTSPLLLTFIFPLLKLSSDFERFVPPHWLILFGYMEKNESDMFCPLATWQHFQQNFASRHVCVYNWSTWRA